MGFLVGQRVGLGVERGSCCCRGEWGEGAPCGGLWGRNSGLSDGKFLVTPRRGRRYILSGENVEGPRGQTERSSAKRAHITCAAMRCTFPQSSSRSLLGQHPLEFALKSSFFDSQIARPKTNHKAVLIKAQLTKKCIGLTSNISCWPIWRLRGLAASAWALWTQRDFRYAPERVVHCVLIHNTAVLLEATWDFLS
jgi:hypothetical protein